MMDNLNTHTKASLYEAFDPPEAKRIADKLEIHYTPQAWQLVKHGGDWTQPSGVGNALGAVSQRGPH